MKKGEMKKQDILHTAESMFCKNGYEATSVQDILDALHTSKGSFYHHFISKESVLEEICSRKAQFGADQIADLISDNSSPLVNLNIILSGMIPFNGEKLSFLLMLLPVFQLSEGVRIKSCYCRKLSEIYTPLIEKELTRGQNQEILACKNTVFMARMITLVINDLWCEICNLILFSETSGKMTDSGELLGSVEQYRLCIERLLSAPYGSIILLDMTDLNKLIEQVHLHWERNSKHV